MTDTEQGLKEQALTVIEQAAMVKITDQPTYNSASSLLLEQIIPFRKRWAEYWEPLKKAAWEAHRSVVAKFNEGDQPAERAEKMVKEEIRKWDEIKERERQELQRKAQEEAERLEQEERLKAAVAAEQAGAMPDEFEEMLNAPIVAVAAPVAPTYEKASGVSVRENWVAVVTDIKKLCLAVAKGQVSAEYVLPNQKALNARARADKRTMNIPGCVAKNEPIVSGRTR